MSGGTDVREVASVRTWSMMNSRSVTSSVRPEGGAQRDWQREPGGLGPVLQNLWFRECTCAWEELGRIDRWHGAGSGDMGDCRQVRGEAALIQVQREKVP